PAALAGAPPAGTRAPRPAAAANPPAFVGAAGPLRRLHRPAGGPGEHCHGLRLAPLPGHRRPRPAAVRQPLLHGLSVCPAALAGPPAEPARLALAPASAQQVGRDRRLCPPPAALRVA